MPIFFSEPGEAVAVFLVAGGSFALGDLTVSFSFLDAALMLWDVILTVFFWCGQQVGAGIFTGGGFPRQRGCLPGGRCLVCLGSCAGERNCRR